MAFFIAKKLKKMDKEITIYLEPNESKINGIYYKTNEEAQITTESNESALTLTVPLEQDKANSCNNTDIEITVLLSPENSTPVQCLLCGKPCDERKGESYSPSMPILPTMACLSGCLGKIRWKENYREIESLSGTKKESLLTLTTEFEIPDLCGIIGAGIEFEVSSCYSETIFEGTADIPEDGSLQFIHEQKYSITWPFTHSESCFYPGESMTAYVILQNSLDSCVKIPVAYGWYETECFTSALIQGAGLIEDTLHNVKNEELIVTNYNQQLYLAQQNIIAISVRGKLKYYEAVEELETTEHIQAPRYSQYRLQHKDIGEFTLYKDGVVGQEGINYEIDKKQGLIKLLYADTIYIEGVGFTKFEIISVTTKYTYYKRNYEVDAANGAITVPADSELKQGQILNVSYKWVESTVVAGGYKTAFNESWIGDPRLYWLVDFKGNLSWVKCADFTAWEIGARCLIYKNGLSEFKSGRGLSNCRNLDDFNLKDEDDNILTDSVVSFTLDKTKDIILPTGAYYKYYLPNGTIKNPRQILSNSFLWGKITSVNEEFDTANLIELDDSYQETETTHSDVPIYFHCDPTATETRGNGAIVGSALGFEINDRVAVEYTKSGKDNQDKKDLRIMSHLDEKRGCYKYIYLFLVGDFTPHNDATVQDQRLLSNTIMLKINFDDWTVETYFNYLLGKINKGIIYTGNTGYTRETGLCAEQDCYTINHATEDEGGSVQYDRNFLTTYKGDTGFGGWNCRFDISYDKVYFENISAQHDSDMSYHILHYSPGIIFSPKFDPEFDYYTRYLKSEGVSYQRNFGSVHETYLPDGTKYKIAGFDLTELGLTKHIHTCSNPPYRTFEYWRYDGDVVVAIYSGSRNYTTDVNDNTTSYNEIIVETTDLSYFEEVTYDRKFYLLGKNLQSQLLYDYDTSMNPLATRFKPIKTIGNKKYIYCLSYDGILFNLSTRLLVGSHEIEIPVEIGWAYFEFLQGDNYDSDNNFIIFFANTAGNANRFYMSYKTQSMIEPTTVLLLHETGYSVKQVSCQAHKDYMFYTYVFSDQDYILSGTHHHNEYKRVIGIINNETNERKEIVFDLPWSEDTLTEPDVELTEEEIEIFNLTNETRTSLGLNALVIDKSAVLYARNWSQKMRSDTALSHSPLVTDLESIAWKARENVASSDEEDPVTAMYDGWLSSQGHYENIIVQDNTHIGIGVVSDGNTYYATQVFLQIKYDLGRKMAIGQFKPQGF